MSLNSQVTEYQTTLSNLLDNYITYVGDWNGTLITFNDLGNQNTNLNLLKDSTISLKKLKRNFNQVITKVTGYVLTIQEYNNGDLQFSTNHGFDSSINGTAYIFTAEDTDPTNLVSGTTYYIRYKAKNKLSLFANKADAEQESDTDAENDKINVSGTIEDDDVHKITRYGYDNDFITGLNTNINASFVKNDLDTYEDDLTNDIDNINSEIRKGSTAIKYFNSSSLRNILEPDSGNSMIDALYLVRNSENSKDFSAAAMSNSATLKNALETELQNFKTYLDNSAELVNLNSESPSVIVNLINDLEEL